MNKKDTQSPQNASWTMNELRAWINADLIPMAYLDPTKSIELMDYVAENIQRLREFYHEKFTFPAYHRVDIPPLKDLPNAYDLQVVDIRTGQVVSTLQQTARLDICEDVSLEVLARELTAWKSVTDTAIGLTNAQSKELKEIILEIAKKGPIAREELIALLEEINRPHVPFVQSIESDEFPLVRSLADQINRLPEIIEGFSEPIETANSSYVITSCIANSKDNKIELEYRYPATSIEQAQKVRQNFTNGILREQLRDALACWAMAGQLNRWEYTCRLTDIMALAYPAHKAKFSGKDKARFYANLQSGALAKFTITKKDKKGKEITQHIPLITILETKKNPTPQKKLCTPDNFITKGNKETDNYPTEITIKTLPSSLLLNGPRAFAGIKTASLGLPREDFLLAAYFDIRRSQLNNPPKKHVSITREEAIRRGNLSGIKHSGMANKKLREKFERIKNAGVIFSYPKRITETMTIQIRK